MMHHTHPICFAVTNLQLGSEHTDFHNLSALADSRQGNAATPLYNLCNAAVHPTAHAVNGNRCAVL